MENKIKKLIESIILAIDVKMEMEEKGWRPSRCYLNGLLHAKNIVKKYLKENVNEK